MIPIVIRKRHLITFEFIKDGILLGIFLFLSFNFQTQGLKYTTATKSGFITASFIVIVPFLQILIEKKMPSKGAVAGLLLVFAGLVFLSTGGNSIGAFINEIGSNFNLGDFLTLCCAFCFALQVVYIDIFSRKYDFWLLVFFQLATISVLSGAVIPFFHAVSLELVKLEFSGYLIFTILYTAVLATVIALSLQAKFQKEVTPAKAGILYSFEPMFAGMFAMILLGEKLSNFGIIGSFLVFSGLIISEIFENLKKKNGK